MIDRIEVRAYVHATEDPQKVLEAIAKAFGLEELPEIEETKTYGHHSNPITILHFELKGREAERAFKNLISAMDDLEFELLKHEVEQRSEGSKLFLRVDKQQAFKGKIRVSSSSDVIWMKIVFKGSKPSKEVLEEIRGSGRGER